MKLLFLGASNTDAGHCFTPDNLGHGYVSRIAKLTGFSVINGGTDGFTFPRILRKYQDFYPDQAFDLCVILGGINEVGAVMDSGMTKKDIDAYLLRSSEALHALLGELSTSGCRSILILEPFLFDSPDFLRSWLPVLEQVKHMIRDTISDFSQQHDQIHVSYITLQPFFEHAASEYGTSVLTPDGIHLSETGHRLLAEYLIPLLK